MSELRQEQARTLETPRLRYGVLARALFRTLDLVYGRRATLDKFEVLEVVARVPYQAWESVAYVALTHTFRRRALARRVFDFVEEARSQQDNEQWHLLILGELVDAQGARYGWLRRRLFPQLLAMLYYHLSWVLYVIAPSLSYRLNAEFEDHAEHEYMAFVKAHPELEHAEVDSAFVADYGVFSCQAELLRQIGLDERAHKRGSLAHLEQPRFGLAHST